MSDEPGTEPSADTVIAPVENAENAETTETAEVAETKLSKEERKRLKKQHKEEKRARKRARREQEQHQRKKSKKSHADSDNESNGGEQSDQQSDDEQSDAEAEEEEEQEEPERPRKKRSNVSRFFEEDVDVDSDDDDASDLVADDDELDEDITDARLAAEQSAAAQRVDARNALLAKQPMYMNRQEEAEAVRREAEFFDKKYGHVMGDDDVGVADLPRAAEQQQARQPSLRDPKLFMVKCAIGKEREALLNLMQRFASREKRQSEDRLLIKSAFANMMVPGIIYVEAEKDIHVKTAVAGVQYLNQWTATLVPLNEMVPCLSASRKHAQVQPGQWVRMKRGVYKDDLGQIDDLEDNGTKATVRIVPRIDYAKLSGGQEEKAAFGRRKGGTERPPARLFNPDEVREYGQGLVERRTYRGIAYEFYGGNRYKHGHLYKLIPVASLIIDDVQPSASEIEQFERKLGAGGVEGEDAEMRDVGGSDDPLQAIAKQAQRSGEVTFTPGTLVRVVAGDLINLIGVVTGVVGSVVQVTPTGAGSGALAGPLDFQANELRKFFKVGDHVKVVAPTNQYRDETGLITSVDSERDVVVIFTDSGRREIQCFSNDVVESTEISSGRSTLGTYALGDMVSIGADSMGVIVRVELESFRILDFKGNVVTVRLQDMGQKRDSKRASTTDMAQATVSTGDLIRVMSGPLKDTQATVNHIYRFYIFAHVMNRAENNGLIVVRGNTVRLVSGLTATTEFKAPVSRGAPKIDPLVNTTVRVSIGQFKGMVGLVREVAGNDVRIELHTVSKTVTVPRSQVVSHSASNVAAAAPLRASSNPFFAPQTPSNFGGLATPSHYGGATPAHYGGATPAYRTPGHRTPLVDGAFGASTPGYDAFAPFTPKTPALGRTPQHSGAGYDGAEEQPTWASAVSLQQQQQLLAQHRAQPATPLGPAQTASSADNNAFLVGCVVEHDGKIGSVKEVLDDSLCAVQFDNRELVLPSNLLRSVRPTQDSRLIFVSGPSRGRSAKMGPIQGDEAVVYLDNSEIEMASLNWLCALQQ